MPIKYSYIPPPSSGSDESDYDGFYFGDQIDKKKRVRVIRNDGPDPGAEMRFAVLSGNLEMLKQKLIEYNFDVDKEISDDCTMLMLACGEGHLPMVRFLVEEKGANVNKQVYSMSPLFLVCNCQKIDDDLAIEIVKILLAHGACINTSDRYGQTPFMMACANGFSQVVRLLIVDVSFDAVDNKGYTAIFHAVERNRIDIVKQLVDAGVNTKRCNERGFTPRNVAEHYGFNDLLDMLPADMEIYAVPSQYITYKNLRDYIPQIFCKTNCPEYFQEVYAILKMEDMNVAVEIFAKAKTTLYDFLTMTDERLLEIGFDLPIQRAKVRTLLISFHMHHWTAKSIVRFDRNIKKLHFSDLLSIVGNQLQEMVFVRGALKFIENNQREGVFGEISAEKLAKFQRVASKYQENVHKLLKTVEYLGSFSPKQNPVYINYDDHLAERKNAKMNTFIRRTTTFTILTVSIIVCLRWKKIF